jgi:hypothetical protein
MSTDNKIVKLRPIMKIIARFKRVLFVVFVVVIGMVCIIGTARTDSGGDSSDLESLGTLQKFTIDSKAVGVTYSISVGLPPGYDGSGPPHQAIFLLDGSWFFGGFYNSYDEDDDHILIGINNSYRRNIDYLPNNTCESERGGRVAFLDFLVSELVPYLDNKYNIDPTLRLLFGHSHGGSFVFYTLFIDHGETFPLLFSNDASLQCWNVYGLEQWYYFLKKSLPVIFYSSGATEGLAYAVRPFMNRIKQRNYVGLIARYDEIQGTHDGILNKAFSRGSAWFQAQIEDNFD